LVANLENEGNGHDWIQALNANRIAGQYVVLRKNQPFTSFNRLRGREHVVLV
jgi:hypothetical protein